MPEMRIYNYCPIMTQKVLKEAYRIIKKTGAIIIKQYDIEEKQRSIGHYYSYKEKRSKVIKCCSEHKRLPEESSITTVIEYERIKV